MGKRNETKNAAGYRLTPGAGAVVRSDIVDVYVFRRAAARTRGVEFLQLWRSSEPLAKSWHPVMGHIEAGETAVECAMREVREEIGVNVGGKEATAPSRRKWSSEARVSGERATRVTKSRSIDNPVAGMWALEQVHPYFIAAINTIVMSARFAMEVTSGWKPVLNDEHGDYRWVRERAIGSSFLWPGQVAACREILEFIVPDRSFARRHLRVI